MVKLRKNLLLHGLTGALSKQFVLKQYGDVTIVTAYPDMSKVKKTEKQKKENQKFRHAMAYARAQMKDPTAKAAYKARAKGLQKPHNVAIADFYNPPEIRSIRARNFQGHQGDVILINAIDDFMVVKVSLEVTDSYATLLETGDAQQINKWNWKYQLQHTYETLASLHVTATAWDKPGNMAMGEVVMPTKGSSG